MQVFEYYFNPKARQDRFFDVFSLEPARDSSKVSVYVIGELANALPQNSGLLQKLFKIISQEYSSLSAPKSQEDFFRALLKRANVFLAAELKAGNIDWLGNFHIALLCIKNSGKKSFFAVAKSGTMRVLMVRGTNVTDVGKNIEGSLRGDAVFGSIVSGALFPLDKLFVLTEDIHRALLKDHSLSDLSMLFGKKDFQWFFQKKNSILSRLSGILFTLLIEETLQTPKLSFLRKHMLSLKLPKFQFSFSQFLRFPLLKAKAPSLIPSQAFKQKLMLVGALVVVVLGGFLLSQGERKELAKQAQTIVLQIQVIQKEAQDALGLSDQRSANLLLQEAFKKASLRTGKEVPFRETFIALQRDLQEQLLSINSIQYVENPSILVDVEKAGAGFIPQQMFLAAGKLYFFNLFSSNIFIFDMEKKKGETVSAPTAVRYGVPLNKSPLFFGEPNLIFSLTKGGLKEFELNNVSSFSGMAGFESNLYFLNSQEGDIVKYGDLSNGAAPPISWIAKESLKKPLHAKSLAIDGNIWILTADNTLQRYFGGLWQEDIKPLMFPFLKNAISIKAFLGNPYLYLLDPSESRVIVLAKSGDLVKQYMMKPSKPLSDFTVSSDGNTLYLLSGSRVFNVAL